MATTDNHGIVIRLDIPPDHHPATVRGESPGANLGRRALTGIYDAYGKINDTAAAVADKGRLASAAQPFAEKAVANAGRAMATLKAQIEHLDGEIAQRLRPTVEPNLAGQIRAHWAGAPGAKALEGVRKAIADGDAATMSAVLSAPAYLSGLSDKSQAVLRLVAAEHFAPEQTARRNETVDALDRVEKANSHFMETIAGRLNEWRDDDARVIQENLT